ncbi:MAG: YHS domain-containing protein [Fimbriimonadaceae bacterium]|nr:YHS domain-containing protein [Fimbriimonadaceae bacterium]
MKSQLTLIIAALLVGFAAIACQPAAEPTGDVETPAGTDSKPAEDGGGTTSTTMGEEVPAFMVDGKLVCPVMGATVESAEKAVGYQDYEGKRYYFCCGMCPEQFEKDPAKFVKAMEEKAKEGEKPAESQS